MNVAIGLLSAAVGGSIVAGVTAWLSRRQQLTDAKRAAYSHLIGAIRTYVLAHTAMQAAQYDEAHYNEFGRRNDDAIFQLHLALAEVELLCPANIRDLVDLIQDHLATAPLEARQAEWDALIDAMRSDISVKD
jgi:hypothetical protein